ncbi:hypothetical protein ACXYMX_14940 [Sporosarcina sp. CAU 1771]
MGLDLQAVEAKGLILKNKEVCHFQCKSYYLDREFKYGPEIFTYRGDLYITNKRIVFIGKDKTVTFQNSSIVRYTFSTYETDFELMVFKENQSKFDPIYVSLENKEELVEILKRLFNQVRFT